MHIPSHPTLIQRMLQARLKQLTASGPVLAGSLGIIETRCGKRSCRCHHGGAKHRAHHLTFKVQNRSRSVYVPQDLLPQVQAWMLENRRLKQLLQEMHHLSVALIRSHVRYRRRRQGRP